MKKLILLSAFLVSIWSIGHSQTGSLFGTDGGGGTSSFNLCVAGTISPVQYYFIGANPFIRFQLNGSGLHYPVNGWGVNKNTLRIVAENGGTISGTNAAGAIVTQSFNASDEITTNAASYSVSGGVTYVQFRLNGTPISGFIIRQDNYSIAFNAVTVPNITPAAPIVCTGGTVNLTANSHTSANWIRNFQWSNGLGTNQVATVSAAGTYQVNVSYTRNNNNAGVISQIACVLPLNVTVSASSVNATLSRSGDSCIGNTINLQALPNGMTYRWNTTPIQTNQSISVVNSGNYTVTVTNADNCTATASTNVNFTSCCMDTNCYWTLKGNTINSNHFIGTKNNQSFNIRTNNFERMRITEGGNVGIGTNNPLERVHVSGSDNVVKLNIENTNVNGGYAELKINSDITDMRIGSGGTGTTPYGAPAGNGYVGTVSNHGLVFATNNTVRAYVANTGNIGIGTITPQNRLHVEGGARVSSLPTVNRIKLVTANATNDLGSIDFPAAGGAVNPTGVFLRGDGTWASASGGMTSTCTTLGRIPKVDANGSSNLTCSQIFDNGTSVGINTTTGNVGGSFNYLTTGTTWFGPAMANGTVRLDVNGVTRSTSYIAFSDGKLKTEIHDIPNSLNIVKQLKGKAYLWNEQAQKEIGADNGVHTGFIAQEIQKVLPNVVVTDESGRLGVNYDEVVPVLVEAIKELNTKVEKQNNAVIENEALKTKIASLEERQASYDEKFALLEKTIAQLCESGCAGLEKKTDVDALYQSIPNPTDSEALINYYLSREYSDASISIYTQDGKAMKTIQLEAKKGSGSIKINLSDLSNGTYIYTLVAGERVIDSKKLQIVK